MFDLVLLLWRKLAFVVLRRWCGRRIACAVAHVATCKGVKSHSMVFVQICSLCRPLASSCDQPLLLITLAQDFAEAGVVDAPGALVVVAEVVVLKGAAGLGVDAYGIPCVAVDAIAAGDGVAVAHDGEAAAGMGDDGIILQGNDALAAEEDAPSTTIVDAIVA
jgi:hypothetical protein